MTSGLFPYTAQMLGPPWYMFCVSLRNFLFFRVNMRITDPEVDSRPALSSCIQRTAWFDRGYNFCVSLRRISRFSMCFGGLRILWSILDFSCPLYLVVTCSCYLPEECAVASFPGDDSRNGFRIQHSSWFNSGYMFDASLRACPAGSTGAVVERQLISHCCSPLTLGLGCAGQQVPQVQSAWRQSRSHCCCSFMPVAVH